MGGASKNSTKSIDCHDWRRLARRSYDANLNLYVHDENSVGTAKRCYLLVRGTNNGQRRFTARKVNCTAHGRSTAFAEKITPMIVGHFTRRNSASAFTS